MRNENNPDDGVFRLIGRVSEEALVCTAALVVKGAAVYMGVSSVPSDALLFSALGIYLTLRLLRVFGLPKD